MDGKNIDGKILDILNRYLKSVNIPQITTEHEEISVQQIKKYVPLEKKTFESLTMSFYYAPTIQKTFIDWFKSQFVFTNGIPISNVYKNTLELLKDNSMKYTFYYVFVTSVQIFDTIVVNSHDLLEIQVTLDYIYLEVSKQTTQTKTTRG